MAIRHAIMASLARRHVVGNSAHGAIRAVASNWGTADMGRVPFVRIRCMSKGSSAHDGMRQPCHTSRTMHAERAETAATFTLDKAIAV